MCGIAGIYNLRGTAPVSRDTIEGMIGALAHRGPDGSGIYLDDDAALGHVRLSIIDLQGGGQPIHNEDETLWIVFNGEIFNYRELRKDLQDRGHRFSTRTDTEVILHLYEESGPDCLHTLNGQFAFAIWDARKEQMFLARDRFGIIPLHYTVTGNSLYFASEVKALFTVPDVERRLDPIAMDQIFTLWTTLNDRTLFRNVHELPAGHHLTASRQGLQMKCYWDVPFANRDANRKADQDEAAARLLDLVVDAVHIRLRADVPVGCYVSGGLDSSAITALVKTRFNNELRTFGIRFEDKAFDEGEYQHHIVQKLGTVHTELLASNADISESFREALWYCEKPLLRTAPVPLYLLSKAVRRNGFKVVLTGEGADEIFGGYDIFREAKILKFWAEQPRSTTRPLLFRKLYPYIFRNDQRASAFVQSFFKAGLDAVDDPLFSHMVRWNTTGRIKAFFSPALLREIGTYSVYDDIREHLPASYGTMDYLAKAQYLESRIFLSNYLLSSQGDRMAMANSVELRPPFLDHRLAEFMATVPPQWKIRGLNEKYLLKKAFHGILPERILHRQKHPYRAPVRGSLAGMSDAGIAHYLSNGSLQGAGLFDPSRVEKLLNKIRMGPHDNETDNMALAGILSAQILHDQFISKNSSPSIASVAPGQVFDRRGRSRKQTTQNKSVHV